MLKISNLNRSHQKHTTWPVEKRIEAVTQYLTVGNMKIVSAVTGVPHQLLRLWKTQPWWKEYEFEIRNAKRIDTNSKLSKIIDKSLSIVEDRLENGEIILNNKTGELVRKPVSLKDTMRTATDLFHQQTVFEKQKIDESSLQHQESIQDTLKQLADEFAKFNGTKRTQVIEAEDIEYKEPEDALHEERDARDAPIAPDRFSEGDLNAIYEKREAGLQEGVCEVPGEAGTDQESSRTQLSPERTLQGRISPKGGW